MGGDGKADVNIGLGNKGNEEEFGRWKKYFLKTGK